MSIEKLQIVKTRIVKTPTRGTNVAAGLDFYVPESLRTEDMDAMFEKTGHRLEYKTDDRGFVTEMTVEFGQSACIPSGIKANIPHGYCMEFHNKSGIGVKKGLLCGAQLIDEDYLGEWHIDVHNVSRNPAVIKAGDKLAQFVMYAVEYPVADVVVSESELFADKMNSERGDGWAGSTGTK